MEFLSSLFEIGGNVASGGLFGLLGSVVGAGAKWLQAKQEAKREASERAHELKLLDMQMQMGSQETENELEIIQHQADAASYGMPVVTANVHMIVNDIRALFRPFLTLSLVGASVWVLLSLLSNLNNGILVGALNGGDPAAQLVAYMVNSLFFTTSTAVVWWFGDRALTPPHLKNK